MMETPMDIDREVYPFDDPDYYYLPDRCTCGKMINRLHNAFMKWTRIQGKDASEFFKANNIIRDCCKMNMQNPPYVKLESRYNPALVHGKSMLVGPSTNQAPREPRILSTSVGLSISGLTMRDSGYSVVSSSAKAAPPSIPHGYRMEQMRTEIPVMPSIYPQMQQQGSTLFVPPAMKSIRPQQPVGGFGYISGGGTFGGQQALPSKMSEFASSQKKEEISMQLAVEQLQSMNITVPSLQDVKSYGIRLSEGQERPPPNVGPQVGGTTPETIDQKEQRLRREYASSVSSSRRNMLLSIGDDPEYYPIRELLNTTSVLYPSHLILSYAKELSARANGQISNIDLLEVPLHLKPFVPGIDKLKPSELIEVYEKQEGLIYSKYQDNPEKAQKVIVALLNHELGRRRDLIRIWLDDGLIPFPSNMNKLWMNLSFTLMASGKKKEEYEQLFASEGAPIKISNTASFDGMLLDPESVPLKDRYIEIGLKYGIIKDKKLSVDAALDELGYPIFASDMRISALKGGNKSVRFGTPVIRDEEVNVGEGYSIPRVSSFMYAR